MNFSVLLQSHHGKFGKVVDFDPQHDRLYPMNFTNTNHDLSDDILHNTGRFSSYVNEILQSHGARYGIGGYDEHRTIYRISSLFDARDLSMQPRRLHLGTDIWGSAGTPVYTPLDAIVHSFAFNDQPGDYGSTIILEHELDAQKFYTLYGHLDLDSLDAITPGKKLTKGDRIAAFGLPAENGQWPPHLHFQLIIDMQGRKGDYPGVCVYAEKEKWLMNSPDPDLVLDMNRFISV